MCYHQVSLQCVIIRISLRCVVVVVVAFHQYIICAFVFIDVCLHSAGSAFNVLSLGLAFNVLLGLAFNVLSSGLTFNVLSSGLAFNVLLSLHFSGLVVQCAVIANSHPTDHPSNRPTDRPPK